MGSDQIPTTTATFRALKSLPFPWIVAALVAGGGGLAGGSFLGGPDPQMAKDLAAIKVELEQLSPKLDVLLAKVEDLDDRAGAIQQAIAVAEASHGRDN